MSSIFPRIQTHREDVSLPSFPSKHAPSSIPKMTQEQAIAILLLLEIYTPALQPKPAPSRHCHCLDYLSQERSGRSLGERPYVALDFYEAVVLLNHIDKIATLPLKEKRQLVSWCLNVTSADHKADGGGSGHSTGWRLTSQRPAVLSETTWSECVKLYQVCLVYASANAELCVQIAGLMMQDGVIIPQPHEPSLPYRFSATETAVRRGGGPGESIYHRFGKLVWEIVYSEDISEALSCRVCGVLGTNWDWLMEYAKDVRANEEPETEIDLLDVRGNPKAVFRLIKNTDGEDEGEYEMNLLHPEANLRDINVDELKAERMNSLILEGVKKAEAAAVTAGCPALPTPKPKVPSAKITNAFKTADAALRKAEKLQNQAMTWVKRREAQRKVEAAAHERVIFGGCMCIDCHNRQHHGHYPGGALGDIPTNTGKAEIPGGEVACGGIGRGGCRTAKNARILTMDAARQLSEAEQHSFIGILEDP
ncbi:hypothetical protein BDD12DRAFT_897361 [Trichophaea hybrida]|nr:hypothetical protein BDD12DRAFT_897361 [Trichophaea hybrida]